MMKVFGLTLVFCFALTMAFAEGMPSNATVETVPAVPMVEAPAAPAIPVVETVTIKGTVIDNACAGSQKAEDLAGFINKHSKKCALKCAASGYAICSDGKLVKFDDASNAKVGEFLKNSKNKLKVVVEANKVDDKLDLISIKNQE